LILGGVHGVARVVLSIVIGGLVWLVTPYVLLGRREPGGDARLPSC
jgi:hypothetical protein